MEILMLDFSGQLCGKIIFFEWVVFHFNHPFYTQQVHVPVAVEYGTARYGSGTIPYRNVPVPLQYGTLPYNCTIVALQWYNSATYRGVRYSIWYSMLVWTRLYPRYNPCNSITCKESYITVQSGTVMSLDVELFCTKWRAGIKDIFMEPWNCE